MQLLPSEGAQIHELWPGAAAAGAGAPGKTGADGAPGNIGASRDWEPAAAPSARSVGSRGTAAADKQSGPADGIQGSAAEASILAFPEPPVRRRRRYVLIGTGVSAALLAALFAVLFFSPALEVKNLQVQGNSLLTVEEAEAALAPLLGTPLTLISDADAGELLAARPEVEKVEVAAVPPSDLLVTITERVPVAVLQNGREFLLIDEDGRQLKAVGERGAAALPLIDGGADAVNSEVFSTVTAVLAALPQGVLAQLDHASAETLDSVELKLANGQTVFWGSSDANAAKAKALEALLLVPATDPPVQVFDVSTPNRPVTR
ncbi:cell division protein FtsQ/DivIB [Arthrobacter sp. Helios]|uniref:cell division protein FtsQ/DivIB n=1 Tax=Arthrobacter sp. Helios TaxID=2828862 RepID=UPI0020633E61|nr:cell division protein FtsQ/DivIB [Arthrobacter sp. Helios]UPO77953.1 cell division protein FtsQ/DivIB [Arthrobacter sp. Helios]